METTTRRGWPWLVGAGAFAVPGTYVYACGPHQGSGMVGRVHVE